MDTVTMVEFRQEARDVVKRVESGEEMILTYRGKPVMRLEPIQEDHAREDDPFYELPDMAAEEGESVSNEEIDRIVYEQ